MTGDMIEVCSKCGKMPRGIDLTAGGLFRCTRCGNTSLTPVTNDDYEKVVTDLDQKFHAELAHMRIEHVRLNHPIELRKLAARANAEKKSSSKRKTSKKPAKKRKK
jgi:hypothetical protein